MVRHLKELRAEKGISQQQLAKVLGISQQSVNKYENHKIEPDIATLVAIADYFAVSIDYLVGRVDPEDGTDPRLELSATESMLIEGYRNLSATERKCIHILINTYVDMANE